MKQKKLILSTLLLSFGLLAACSGNPSTKEEPSITPAPEATVSPQPSPEATVQYLQKRFQVMGYEVTLQPYTSSDGKNGSRLYVNTLSEEERHPTNYVSRYGANQFHEDIADTFTVFVLGERPAGNTVAEEKILLFWDDPDMVNIRNEIRENIGLEH